MHLRDKSQPTAAENESKRFVVNVVTKHHIIDIADVNGISKFNKLMKKKIRNK